ncbi:CRISPR-associated endonuclease Cas3'' [Candidatus Hecatella orcuttiae]|uniref:CRISPR-associated endonuclease Cas3'' n=1 Tax=Candidatus Hecatella orcuttiae TaxID=1935119 RepID=UPI00286830CF|nr:CRISPR-associated endonuclease Cas3'' [Candidatus Hecatella orcuttiae]
MNSELAYSWCGERLEEHSHKTSEIFKLTFEDRIIKTLSGRLNYKFNDVGKFIIRLIPLLHDIGKSHVQYQNTIKFKERCPKTAIICRECKDKPNFSWHEVLSAQLCWRVIEDLLFNLSLYDRFKNLQEIATASILFHHQGIRAIESETPLKEINLKEYLNETLYTLLPKLIDIAHYGLKLDGHLIREIVSSALQELESDLKSTRSLKGLSTRILNELRTAPKNYLKLYSITAGPLVICDWIAARVLRIQNHYHYSPMLNEAVYSFPELETYLK